jgi:RNA polymerase sigma factor for flagellar operon FliA
MFCSGDGLESRLIAKDLLHKIKLSLSERDYKVLHLYYAGKYTMKEIGRMLGVTEARISQIHSKMIQGIREKWSL